MRSITISISDLSGGCTGQYRRNARRPPSPAHCRSRIASARRWRLLVVLAVIAVEPDPGRADYDDRRTARPFEGRPPRGKWFSQPRLPLAWQGRHGAWRPEGVTTALQQDRVVGCLLASVVAGGRPYRAPTDSPAVAVCASARPASHGKPAPTAFTGHQTELRPPTRQRVRRDSSNGVASHHGCSTGEID